MQSGDTQISIKVCSHCQQRVIEYRFIAGDGLSIITYHCLKHGDVVPRRDAGVCDELRPH